MLKSVKILFAVICLLLAFPFLPSGESVNADDGYSLVINQPASGAVIDTPDLNISISWTKPSSTWNAYVNVVISAVSLDNPSGQEAWLQEKLEIGSDAFQQDSVTWTYNQYFASGWSLLGVTPSGQYKMDVTLRNLTDIFATASSAFTFKAAPAPPAAPTGLTATLNGSYVDLKWTDNANNEAGFTIERATSSDFSNGLESFSVGANVVAYSDTTVGFSSTYYYDVYAHNNGGNSGLSNTVSVKTGGISVITPPVIGTFKANREVVVTGRPVELSWAVTGADSVSIDQGIGTVSPAGKQSISPTVTAEYTLTAVNAAGIDKKSVTVGVAPDEIQAILYLYAKFDYAGKDYGLGAANGFYADASHMLSDPAATKVVGSVDGQDIKVSVMDDGGIICGDYQASVLTFLDTLRKSPVYHDLTDGVDYGPVSSSDGFLHHWVRVWPRGTDWRTNGFNLDPWYHQVTEYTSGLKYLFEPDALYDGKYPLTGAALYPDEKPLFTFKPQANTKQVIVECPVNVLITNQAGQRIGGISDGQIVNEISGAGVLNYPQDDGTSIWYFGLLPDDIYKTEITGTGTGLFRLFTAVEGNIQDYGQQPISTGKQAQMTLDPANPVPPLVLPDGKTVTPYNSASTPSPKGKGLNWSLILGITGGVILMLIILGVARRKRK